MLSAQNRGDDNSAQAVASAVLYCSAKTAVNTPVGMAAKRVMVATNKAVERIRPPPKTPIADAAPI